MKNRRIIINNDFYNIFQIEPPVTDQDILDAVDKISGGAVDALFLMVPSTIMLEEGRVLDEDLVSTYDHPDTDPCISNIDAVLAAGKDPFKMVVDRAMWVAYGSACENPYVKYML